MKSYVIIKDDGNISLYATERRYTQYSSTFTPFSQVEARQIALALLLDWFGSEDEVERKALLLSPGVGRRMARVGALPKALFTTGRTGWVLAEERLSEIVTDVLCQIKEAVECHTPTREQVAVIEYVGQRRDIYRDTAAVRRMRLES